MNINCIWKSSIDLKGFLLKHDKLNSYSKYQILTLSFIYRKKRALKETSASEVVSEITEFTTEIEKNSKLIYLLANIETFFLLCVNILDFVFL